MASRAVMFFWTLFLGLLIISVGLMIYICSAKSIHLPLGRVSVTSNSTSAMSYEMLIGGTSIWYRQAESKVEWLCLNASSGAPPSSLFVRDCLIATHALINSRSVYTYCYQRLSASSSLTSFCVSVRSYRLATAWNGRRLSRSFRTSAYQQG